MQVTEKERKKNISLVEKQVKNQKKKKNQKKTKKKNMSAGVVGGYALCCSKVEFEQKM